MADKRDTLEGDITAAVDAGVAVTASKQHDLNALCVICYSNEPTNRLVNCGHRFCEDCIMNTFAAGLLSGVKDFECLSCSEPVTEEELKEYFRPQVYEKYLDRKLQRYLALLPNVRRCIAPDCPYLYILDDVSDCTDDHLSARSSPAGQSSVTSARDRGTKDCPVRRLRLDDRKVKQTRYVNVLLSLSLSLSIYIYIYVIYIVVF